MKKYISPCLLFFGVIAFGASVFIGYYLVPHKVWENVMQQSTIERNNTRFNNWEVIPVPLFQRIYFFNVTNPDEVTKGGKPNLQEVGPYVYQQKRRKFDIVFNNNGTIFYKEKTDYFFREDLSSGPESDWITTVNLPYLGTVNKASSLDVFTRSLIAETLQSYPEENLYVNVTIGNLLFGGRYLPFMKELAELKGEKEILPNNTFAIYYGKNGTDQGRFEIYSGVQHPDKFGNVISWNGQNELDWWGNYTHCNKINGSDGGVFRPYATKERVFQMFIPGLCKSFRFTYESDEEIYGVPLYKYSIKRDFFENPRDNPDNACYCSNPGENFEKCPESGVSQLTGCGKVGMVLSQPHFYQGSDTYQNQSTGLQPDKDKHEMALHIEAYTGVSIKINIRFQMNVELKPNKQFRPLKKIPNMIHPIFWIDQSVLVPEESAAPLRDKLHATINTVNLITHIGMVVGCIMIILSLLFFYWCSQNEEYPETKSECVSYQPRSMFSDEQIVVKAVPNGILKSNQQFVTIKEREAVPFLQQNGKPIYDIEDTVNDSKESSSERVKENELLSTNTVNSPPCDGDDPQNEDACDNSHQHIGVVSHDTQDQSELAQVELELSTRPDSRLSPFPQTTDFSSSISIADNTLKNTIEAMSSYENL